MLLHESQLFDQMSALSDGVLVVDMPDMCEVYSPEVNATLLAQDFPDAGQFRLQKTVHGTPAQELSWERVGPKITFQARESWRFVPPIEVVSGMIIETDPVPWPHLTMLQFFLTFSGGALGEDLRLDSIQLHGNHEDPDSPETPQRSHVRTITFPDDTTCNIVDAPAMRVYESPEPLFATLISRQESPNLSITPHPELRDGGSKSHLVHSDLLLPTDIDVTPKHVAWESLIPTAQYDELSRLTFSVPRVIQVGDVLREFTRFEAPEAHSNIRGPLQDR